MSWKFIGNLSSLASLWTNSDKIEDDLEEDIEGDGGEEEDSRYPVAERPSRFKRQYSYMDDNEGMPPFQSSTRLVQLIDSSLVKIFDSASELTGLIFDGNPEPKYVAVAPTAITSNLSVEGQKPFFGATRGDFAWISPLFIIMLLWLVIFYRARKQRRAGIMDCELVGPYSSPGMEMKGDLESGVFSCTGGER